MAAHSDDTLDGIASELYVLPPDEFTAARNARAKDLADASLARQVRALRKPLVAAWLVNVFAHERRGELDEALELAAQLREAQEDLDARALTALTRQRRELVHALARQAAELGATRGEKITQATTDAVEQTLNAAMFNPDAAAAVSSGRLIRPLEASSDDSAAFADAVAGGLGTAPGKRLEPVDELKERRARKEAERALRDAEQQLSRVQREHDDIDRRRQRAGEELERLTARERELEAALARARDGKEHARAEHEELDAALADVDGRLEQARRAVDEARSTMGG